MAKKMHTRTILEKLIEMLSEKDFVTSVSKGDLSQLPSPQYFRSIMPMVLVTPGKVRNEYVNGDPRVGILNQTYNFDIIYVRYVDLEQEDYDLILETLMDEGEQLVELLMERDTLDDLPINEGIIVGSLVKEVDFNSSSYQVYKDLNIPASLCKFSLEVYFRSKRF